MSPPRLSARWVAAVGGHRGLRGKKWLRKADGSLPAAVRGGVAQLPSDEKPVVAAEPRLAASSKDCVTKLTASFDALASNVFTNRNNPPFHHHSPPLTISHHNTK